MTDIELKAILDDTVLFKELDPKDFDLTVIGFKTGENITDRPAGIPSLGIVASGRVDVFSVAADSNDVILNTLQRGDCFGIYNLLADCEMETVLRCGKDAEIVYLSKESVKRMMSQNPTLAMRYASLCNRKLQFLIQRIELLTAQSSRGKLAAFLLSEADEKGELKLKLPREDFARQLGVSRAALFRELSFLQSEGVLETKGKNFKVTDREKLLKIIRSDDAKE